MSISTHCMRSRGKSWIFLRKRLPDWPVEEGSEQCLSFKGTSTLASCSQQGCVTTCHTSSCTEHQNRGNCRSAKALKYWGVRTSGLMSSYISFSPVCVAHWLGRQWYRHLEHINRSWGNRHVFLNAHSKLRISITSNGEETLWRCALKRSSSCFRVYSLL